MKNYYKQIAIVPPPLDRCRRVETQFDLRRLKTCRAVRYQKIFGLELNPGAVPDTNTNF